MDHLDISYMLGVYAVHACHPEEAIEIERHLRTCADCATELACFEEVTGWMGVSEARLPPTTLRFRILTSAQR